MFHYINLKLYSRSSQWWEYIVLNTFDDYDWKENFRMSRETFRVLCNQLKPIIERKTTKLRESISVEKRLAIILWFLATTAEYRTIAHLFGVARSSVREIVWETTAAIVHCLLSTYINFPVGKSLKSVVDGFFTKWSVPQCAGAIDGSHIAIKPPLNHTDYYNRKGWYSILVQAVVDHNYLFRDICVGWPGSVHDARVYANSKLYQNAIQGKILNGNKREIANVDVPVYLIGDSAYPLSTFLMKPFDYNITQLQDIKQYNYRVSRARIVTENAFGRLKAIKVAQT